MQSEVLNDRLGHAVAHQRLKEGGRRIHELAEYVDDLRQRGLDALYYEHKLARLRVQMAEFRRRVR